MGVQQDGETQGLLSALKNIATTLLASGKTRLELLGNEIEEEKLRAVRLVLLAQGMVFCFGVGTVLMVALLVVLFWESRFPVLALSAGGFIAAGAVFCVLFKRATHRPKPIFDASISELQEDIRQLKAVLSHEPPAQ